MQNEHFAKLYFLQARSYIASQLYLPTASDIAHFVRSCGESGFLSLRHFVPPPSSDGGFFGGSKPTALLASPCKAGFHHAVISSERSEDFIAERFHLPVAGCVKTRYLDA